MLATEWSFGNVLWTMLVFFFWFMAIWIFIMVFSDIFRRRDLSGWAKGGWIILIFIVPFLGAIIYLIARPKMTEQDKEDMARMQEAERRVSGYSPADEVAKLVEAPRRGQDHRGGVRGDEEARDDADLNPGGSQSLGSSRRWRSSSPSPRPLHRWPGLAQPLRQMLTHPDRVRHRRERRVHGADAREEARVDDVQVVELVRLAVARRAPTSPGRDRTGTCRPGARPPRWGCSCACRSSWAARGDPPSRRGSASS